VGKRADLVVLDAGNPIEAIRLRATRLLVMARGKIIARRERSPMRLEIPGRETDIDRRFTVPEQR